MPLEAEADKFAPPSNEVAESAAAYVPTVLTVAGLSTRKSAGSAGPVPMTSKFCVTAVLVDSDIAAQAAHVKITIKKEISATVAEFLRAFWDRETRLAVGAVGIVILNSR
jgi:hypothetical protein